MLMDHIEEVVLKLHEIPKYGRGRRNRILQATKQNYTQTVHGRQLSDALARVKRPDPNSSSKETENEPTRDFNSASEMRKHSTEEQTVAFDSLPESYPDKYDDEECQLLVLTPAFSRSRTSSCVEELEKYANQNLFKSPVPGDEETCDSGFVRSISFPSFPLLDEFGHPTFIPPSATFIPPSATGSGSIHSSDLDFHVTSLNDDYDREISL